MKRILAILAVAAALLAAILAASIADAAPLTTMASVKTTVTKIIQRPDYCTIWVARGMNGNVLEEAGPVCGLKPGGRITINYAVDYKPVCDWRGRNCKSRIVYVYDNAYPGW